MERIQLADGQVLFEQGDSEAAFYLIESGQIRIYKSDRNGKEISLDTLDAGKTLGELALIDAQPHSVTAASLGSSNLLRLNRNDFLERVYNSAELSQLLIQLGNQRLRCLTDYIKKLEAWIDCVADSQCNDVIEVIEDFDIRRDGIATSSYLSGILAKVADSFKNIVQTIQQLKGSEYQFEVKLKFEIDEHQHQEEVEEIVHAEYFSYLVELAELRNTVSNTVNSGEGKDKILPFNQSGVESNSQNNHLAIKQALIKGLQKRSEFFNSLIIKAWEDEQFRQELLTNPKAVYAKEFGCDVPEGLEIQVIEGTLGTVKMVLPINLFSAIAEEELSEKALDAVAGGNWAAMKDIFNNSSF